MKVIEKHGWEIYPGNLEFESPVVNIYAGPVKCKRSGQKKSFYFMDFPDWVNVIAVTSEKQMVLIRQFRYGSGKMELEIPGGVIEPGESPVEAGLRELLEECGYAGKNARVIGGVNPNPAVQKNCCYTVLVEDAVKVAEQSMDDMEDIELSLMPEKEVLNGFITGELGLTHGLVLNALSFYLNTKLSANIGVIMSDD